MSWILVERNYLLASKSISVNIGKARRSFFLHGCIGAFQGDLNPLSTRSIIVACVLLELLSGCENWILSSKFHVDLESFVWEIAKRVLKWPKHFSNTAALVVLDLPGAKSYLLQRKLTFLRRQLISDLICSDRGGIVDMKYLSNDPESLCLVKECKELESCYSTNFTSEILSDADSTNPTNFTKLSKNLTRSEIEKVCLEGPLITLVAPPMVILSTCTKIRI